MQFILDLDDETGTYLQTLAKEEQCSPGSIIARALRRLPRQPGEVPSKAGHGYVLPVSPGRPFTMEDVYRIEDENDMRGM